MGPRGFFLRNVEYINNATFERRIYQDKHLVFTSLVAMSGNDSEFMDQITKDLMETELKKMSLDELWSEKWKAERECQWIENRLRCIKNLMDKAETKEAAFSRALAFIEQRLYALEKEKEELEAEARDLELQVNIEKNGVHIICPWEQQPRHIPSDCKVTPIKMNATMRFTCSGRKNDILNDDTGTLNLDFYEEKEMRKALLDEITPDAFSKLYNFLQDCNYEDIECDVGSRAELAKNHEYGDGYVEWDCVLTFDMITPDDGDREVMKRLKTE